MKRIVVLISGRGRNLQAIIDATNCGDLPAQVVRVIANRADAQGLTLARAAGIATEVLQHADYPTREAFDQALLDSILPLQPDAVALAGFMRILTPGFVRALEGRLLNIHPSLLPRHPGLDTHARALAAGDAEHGATVHFVTHQLDGGPPIVQSRLAVDADDTAATLASRVLESIETRIYPLALRWLMQGDLRWEGGRPFFRGRVLDKALQI